MTERRTSEEDDAAAEGRRSKPRPPRSRARRVLRRVLQVVAILILLPVVLVLAVVGYLSTDAGQERVRARVEARLQRQVHGTAKVGSLELGFGGLTLRDVVIEGQDGRRALSLGLLRVRPSWRAIVRGDTVELEEITVERVRVDVVKQAEGSNFTGLFEPYELTLKKPVVIRSLRVSDVAVSVLSPDGTALRVEDVAISGSVWMQRSTKTFRVDLPEIAASVGLDKPASGLSLGVRDLKTGLHVGVEQGVGEVALLPLSARVELAVKPRGIERAVDVSLGGITLDIAAERAAVDLEKLAIGVLTLAAVEVRAPTEEGQLAGVPAGEVVGLRVVASELNGLLGKDVLRADADLDVHLGGSPSAPELKAHLAVGGGTVDVAGTFGQLREERPTFDVRATLSNLDTTKIVGAGLSVPAAKVGELRLDVKGQGKAAETMDAHADLTGRGLEVRGIPVDRLHASADLSGGRVEVTRLEVEALGQHVGASGRVALGSKEIDLTLGVAGDSDSALAALGEAGLPVGLLRVPRGLVSLPKDDLKVSVKGAVGGELDVSVRAKKIGVLGARVSVDASATILRGDKEKGEKPVTVRSLDARLSVHGLLLSTVLGLRGRTLPKGFDAAVDVDVVASGTPEDPKAKVTIAARTIRSSETGAKLPLAALRAVVDVTRTLARLDLTVADKDSPADVLLRAKAELPLSLSGDKRGLDAGGRFRADVEVPRRTLMSLAGYSPLLPLPPLSALRVLAPVLEQPNGDIALRASFDGTVARPKGSLDLSLATKKLVGEAKQTLHVAARVDSAAGQGTAADASVRLSLSEDRPALAVDAKAKFPVSPLLGGASAMTYDVRAVVGPLPLASLPPLERLERVRGVGGVLSGSIAVRGDRRSATGDLTLDLTGASPGGKGPIDLHAKLSLLPGKTDVDVSAALAGAPLVELVGDAGLGGTDVFARVKQGGIDPPLHLTLRVPDRPLASLSVIRPALASAPGTLGGAIEIAGTAKVPTLSGAVGVRDVEMANGAKGGAALSVVLDQARAVVGVSLGVPGPTQGTVEVEVPRAAIAGYGRGEPVTVAAKATLPSIPLASLVPAFVAKEARSAFTGTVESDLSARIELEKGPSGPSIERADLGGGLRLHQGTFRIPGTKRSYERVELRLALSNDRIALETLEAHETTRDVKDRWLKVRGEVRLKDLRPTALDLHLSADKWLVFGARVVGLADAPRGTLDLDARATMELDRPVKTAVVDVKRLALLIPDRFDKAHNPEEVHWGDVTIVGDGPAVGKLAVPPKPAPPPPAPPPSDPRAGPTVETGMDIEVRVARGAKLLQSPIELHPEGTLTIAVRPSGRTVRGRLDMRGGELSLGGKMHPLARGSLTFDDKAPQGWLDLTFSKKLPPWALRNVSSESGSDSVDIHMFGPISDRRTVLSGAGPGALFDLLSMHNVGRERFVSEPNLPETQAAEFPQHMGLLTLSFLSVNLPHLLFLDRVAAWSDPTSEPRTYGRLERYEGDRYFADGKGRIRAERRPADVGRSEADVEALYLIENSRGLLFGVGGAAGSRGGGGPGVVLEWSSER